MLSINQTLTVIGCLRSRWRYQRQWRTSTIRCINFVIFARMTLIRAVFAESLQQFLFHLTMQENFPVILQVFDDTLATLLVAFAVSPVNELLKVTDGVFNVVL